MQVSPRLADQLTSNFDISVVMPFYRKMDVFRRTFAQNRAYLQRNGIEVIICMDEPEGETELLELVQQHPFINWKILVNRKPRTGWRNPCKAINTGIRHATKKYVLVMGPDSEMYTDIIFQFCYHAQFYPGHYCTGLVIFTDEDFKPDTATLHTLPAMPYGSIMAERSWLLAIGGYDESFSRWGGDDDNIRARLDLYGVQQLSLADAILLHREQSSVSGQQARLQKSQQLSAAEKKYIYYPARIHPNPENWGRDFDECIYDYRNNKYAARLLPQYLQSFPRYQTNDAAIFSRHYRLIALLPVYNEIGNIPELLQHLHEFCDGIILLDDGSTDGTYEAATGEKLLLKVQKQRGDCFNDRENRNILLDLASFFHCEWFFCLDADERLYDPGNLMPQLPDETEADVIIFPKVHLWNDEQHYRSAEQYYPDTPPGVMLRNRMFRNKGRMQYHYTRMLHFPHTPFVSSNRRVVPVLIKHYGTLTEQDRIKKYDFYMQEDKDKERLWSQYKPLLNHHGKVQPLATLNLDEIVNGQTGQSE